MAIDVKRGIRRLLIALIVAYWAGAGWLAHLAYEGAYGEMINAVAQDGPDAMNRWEPVAISSAGKVVRRLLQTEAIVFAVLVVVLAIAFWVYRGFRKPTT
jgi:hypothetical protein